MFSETIKGGSFDYKQLNRSRLLSFVLPRGFHSLLCVVELATMCPFGGGRGGGGWPPRMNSKEQALEAPPQARQAGLLPSRSISWSLRRMLWEP